jgi:hypothetical protein
MSIQCFEMRFFGFWSLFKCLKAVKHRHETKFATIALVAGLFVCICPTYVTASTVHDPLVYIEKHSKSYDRELLDFAGIPSIASISTHYKDVEKASQWLVARLQRAGLQVNLH